MVINNSVDVHERYATAKSQMIMLPSRENIKGSHLYPKKKLYRPFEINIASVIF